MTYSRAASSKLSNIAFELNLAAGLFLTILVFFIAPFAADFFRNEEVTPVLRWLGLTFVLSSFGSVHNVLLQRELNFKKRIIPDLGNTLIKAVISISLALTGFGVWALVAGQLIGTATQSIMLWVVQPWRPRFHWNPRIAKELFKYGLSIMGINALSIWEDSFDYLVIGRLYNSTLLGIYTIAYRLPEMLVINTLWVMTAVIFPAFSSLQDDTVGMRKLFLSIVRYIEILVTPICLGMVVAADPIIRVVFGEQWVEAIPILRVLSLYAWIVSVGYHVGDIYKAVGRPDILVKLQIPIFIIRVIALWIGAQYSILGVSVAHLVVALIALVIQIGVASRFVKITFFDIVKELKAFLGGAVLVIAVLPALYFTRDNSPIIQLLLVVPAGAAGYLGSMWFIEHELLFKALQMIGFKQIEKEAK
jgi:lipopolysaccharide exporter